MSDQIDDSGIDDNRIHHIYTYKKKLGCCVGGYFALISTIQGVAQHGTRAHDTIHIIVLTCYCCALALVPLTRPYICGLFGLPFFGPIWVIQGKLQTSTHLPPPAAASAKSIGMSPLHGDRHVTSIDPPYRRGRTCDTCDWFYDSSPPKPAVFFDEHLVAACSTQGRILWGKNKTSYILFAKDYWMMTSGWQRASYFRKYGRELVSKPAIVLKKRVLGGYRRTTLVGQLIFWKAGSSEKLSEIPRYFFMTVYDSCNLLVVHLANGIAHRAEGTR